MSSYKIFNGPESIKESNAPWDDIVTEDFHVIVFRDRYPVTPGHLLFVPKYNSISVLNDAFEDAVRYGNRKVQEGEFDA